MQGDPEKEERMQYDGPATFPNGCNHLNAAKCDLSLGSSSDTMGRFENDCCGNKIPDNQRICCPLGGPPIEGTSWGFSRYQCQCNQNPIKCKPTESLEQIQSCDNTGHDTVTTCTYKMVFS